MKKYILLVLCFIVPTFSIFSEPVLVCPGGVWDYAEVLNSAPLAQITSKYTIEAWIKWYPIYKKSQQVVAIAGELQKGWGYGLALSEGILTYKTKWTDIKDPSGTVIPSGVWTHVAIAIEDGLANFYINGNYTGSGTGAALMTYNFPFYFGGYWPTWGLSVDIHSAPFFGSVAELRLWSSQRTDSEILNNYKKRLTGTENDLFARYAGTLINSGYSGSPMNFSLTHTYWHDEPPEGTSNITNTDDNTLTLESDSPDVDILVPQGWVYFDWPYMYSVSSNNWFYIDTNPVKYYFDLYNLKWFKF